MMDCYGSEYKKKIVNGQHVTVLGVQHRLNAKIVHGHSQENGKNTALPSQSEQNQPSDNQRQNYRGDEESLNAADD